MPETDTRTEWRRVGPPLRVGGTTLLLVEQGRVQALRSGTGAWLWASQGPLAVLVRHAGRVHALGIDGAMLDLGALRAAVTGLDTGPVPD